MAAADETQAVKIANQYFAHLDAGSPQLVDLFTDDVQIYFPKFGLKHGKQALIEGLTGVGSVVESFEHVNDSFVYTFNGHRLAVEGATRGVLKNGIRWAGGETPGGRFCSVFEFRGNLISRLHIYLDPDYGGEDDDRFFWGREQRAW